MKKLVLSDNLSEWPGFWMDKSVLEKCSEHTESGAAIRGRLEKEETGKMADTAKHDQYFMWDCGSGVYVGRGWGSRLLDIMIKEMKERKYLWSRMVKLNLGIGWLRKSRWYFEDWGIGNLISIARSVLGNSLKGPKIWSRIEHWSMLFLIISRQKFIRLTTDQHYHAERKGFRWRNAPTSWSKWPDQTRMS